MRLLPIQLSGVAPETASELGETVSSVLLATRQMYRKKGFSLPWIGYWAVVESSVVGTCGFTSPPNDNVVEIAYFAFPENEGRGYATEMAKSLVAIATEYAPEIQITAHTLVARNASHRILEKNGFVIARTVEDDEDGTILVWNRAN